MSAPYVQPLLWFTSNTPIQCGQRECSYERWLNFHAGPHGTGYRRITTSIPLATGSAVHKGVEHIGKWILDWQAGHPHQRLLKVPDEVIAWAASETADAYQHRASTRGLAVTRTDATAAHAINQLILEQRTLIEALVWVYALWRLPVMLAEHRLLFVEEEEAPVIACTCGLGDWVGQSMQHELRGCQGIVPQAREDLVWEGISDGAIRCEQIKTKATPNSAWENSFLESGQLLLGMEAVSKRIGRPVTETFVPVLFKGKRERGRGEPDTAPKIQQSPLVWPWRREAALNQPAEWAASWEWWDEQGKKHTIGSTFKRVALWDMNLPLDSRQNPNGVEVRAGASRVERWLRGWVSPRQIPYFLKTLGPFARPLWRVPAATDAIIAEEQRWRADVEELRDAGAFTPEHPRVQQVIPRSWACTKFDGTPCQFKSICMQEVGWDQIETNGRFERRRPHHSTELRAFEALGVQFPPGEDEDEQD